MIVKLGTRHPVFLLYSRDKKKILGTHKTLAKAKAQEHAISISKARAAGHRIPRPRR